MFISLKNKHKQPKTFIHKVINYVWLVIGVSAFIPSFASAFMQGFPILFLVILLISIGTAITGMIVKFTPLIISGFLGMFLSVLCLVLRNSYDSILVFAALFFFVQVISGHILNWKGRKK